MQCQLPDLVTAYVPLSSGEKEENNKHCDTTFSIVLMVIISVQTGLWGFLRSRLRGPSIQLSARRPSAGRSCEEPPVTSPAVQDR